MASSNSSVSSQGTQGMVTTHCREHWLHRTVRSHPYSKSAAPFSTGFQNAGSLTCVLFCGHSQNHSGLIPGSRRIPSRTKETIGGDRNQTRVSLVQGKCFTPGLSFWSSQLGFHSSPRENKIFPWRMLEEKTVQTLHVGQHILLLKLLTMLPCSATTNHSQKIT